jgi:superfamily II DNA or RNA helicase
MPVSARDYQQSCHDAVLAAWGVAPWYSEGETYDSVLANLTTSAGKTFIAGYIIHSVLEKKLGRCLFLADTDELCRQPRLSFWDHFRIGTAVEKAGDKASIMSDVVVGSAQTLARPERLQRYKPDHFQFIFVDEAHRGSDRNKAITDHFPAAKIMGMTATPFRARLADLSDYYQHVAFEMGMFDLIDEGYISPIKILTLPVKVDLRNVHQTMSTEGMDYDKNELDTTIAPYYEEICRLILEHAADRHIIAYLPLIKSSQAFVSIAQGMGINARHVDGKSPNREELLRQFGAGAFQLLSNSNLLTTGWDCPRCDCLLNLAPTRSAGLFRQKVGRIGRILKGVIDGIRDRDERKAAIASSAKPDALILDLLWQTQKFGLMGPADLIASNEEERAAIQLKLAGVVSAQDLQGVSAAVQAEREEALKKALIEAAKRQRKGEGADSVDMVAALLHGKKVLNYEPVMNWERKPVTSAQREWLTKQGIDPDTARDRGHAKALMDLIFTRKKLGFCSHRAVEALENRMISGAVQMTDWQAYEILGGNFPFPFGKHARAGHTFRQVPSSFWRWVGRPEQYWIKKAWPVVWDWADSVIDKEAGSIEEGRCQCIGSHQAPNCPVHPRKSEPETVEDALDAVFGDMRLGDAKPKPKTLEEEALEVFGQAELFDCPNSGDDA